MITSRHQNPVIDSQRFFILAKLLKNIPAPDQRFGLILIDRKYPLVTFERVVMALQGEQGIPPIDERREIVGADVQRLIVAIQRLLVSPAIGKRYSAAHDSAQQTGI